MGTWFSGLTGGLDAINARIAHDKAREEAAQDTMSKLLQSDYEKQYLERTPEQNESAFGLMAQNSGLPQAKMQQLMTGHKQMAAIQPSAPELTADEQMWQSGNVPLPTDVHEAPISRSPYDEKIFEIKKQLTQPNLSLKQRDVLWGQMYDVRSQALKSSNDQYERMKTLQQGQTALQDLGADEEMQRNFAYSSLGGKFMSSGTMFPGTWADRQGFTAEGEMVPFRFNTKTGESQDLNGQQLDPSLFVQITQPIRDRFMQATDPSGNVRVFRPLEGKQSVQSMGGIGRRQAILSPAAQQALIAGAGGDIGLGMAGAPGALAKSQVANFGAKPKQGQGGGTLSPPPTSAEQPVIAPQMQTTARNLHEQLLASTSEIDKAIAKLRVVKPDQFNRLLVDSLKYMVGSDSDNSGLIADLNRVKVFGGAAYMKAGGTQALKSLLQVQEHLPRATYDSIPLMITKLQEARTALVNIAKINAETGAKGFTTGGALQQVENVRQGGMTAPPSAGTFVVKAPSGATKATTRENAIEYLKRPGYVLVQGDLNAK